MMMRDLREQPANTDSKKKGGAGRRFAIATGSVLGGLWLIGVIAGPPDKATTTTHASTIATDTPTQTSPTPALTIAPSRVRTADFGPSDLSQIVSTSQNQEARFRRDYKGKTFAATGQVTSVSAGFFNRYNIAVRVAGDEVNCWVKTSAKDLADIESGQRVQISGEIRDTVFGDLQIDSCRVN